MFCLNIMHAPDQWGCYNVVASTILQCQPDFMFHFLWTALAVTQVHNSNCILHHQICTRSARVLYSARSTIYPYFCIPKSVTGFIHVVPYSYLSDQWSTAPTILQRSKHESHRPPLAARHGTTGRCCATPYQRRPTSGHLGRCPHLCIAVCKSCHLSMVMSKRCHLRSSPMNGLCITLHIGWSAGKFRYAMYIFSYFSSFIYGAINV
jgi:hypothetical protein